MATRPSIRWKVDTKLSLIHAAHTVAVGSNCIDEKLERAFVTPATEINQRLVSASIDVRSFWDSLYAQALRNDSLADACEASLIASGCSELLADQTGRVVLRQLDECRIALLNRFPRLADQLELRARPLKERWETVGPGLLHSITKQIWNHAAPKSWWPNRVDTLLVQPVRGGDGGFEPSESTVWIEAILTDNDPLVPEVLRLVWLITRVAVERHLLDMKISPPPLSSSDSGITNPLSARRAELRSAWALAVMAFTLHAGAELEVTRGNPLPIADAMRGWHVSDDVLTARCVTDWWAEIGQLPSPLPAAIQSLIKRLQLIRSLSPANESVRKGG